MFSNDDFSIFFFRFFFNKTKTNIFLLFFLFLFNMVVLFFFYLFFLDFLLLFIYFCVVYVFCMFLIVCWFFVFFFERFFVSVFKKICFWYFSFNLFWSFFQQSFFLNLFRFSCSIYLFEIVLECVDCLFFENFEFFVQIFSVLFCLARIATFKSSPLRSRSIPGLFNDRVLHLLNHPQNTSEGTAGSIGIFWRVIQPYYWYTGL